MKKLFIILSFVFMLACYVADQLTAPVRIDGLRMYFVVCAVLLISPIIVLWFQKLWNCIVPEVFGWREITFIESIGILALSLMLF